MASVRGLLNIQSLNESTHEKCGMTQVVDHPTTSLGHTTQAGTSHTNWADPIFSRLLSQGSGTVLSCQTECACARSEERGARSLWDVEHFVTVVNESARNGSRHT